MPDPQRPSTPQGANTPFAQIDPPIPRRSNAPVPTTPVPIDDRPFDVGDWGGRARLARAAEVSDDEMAEARRRLEARRAEQMSTQGARKPCRHDSARNDGTLDAYCLHCGADGYWHDGHRHDQLHPSGKVLISLACPAR